MALDIASNGDRSILEWDEDHVHQWLSSLGFPQYEQQIKDHKISGDALCMLDAEALKAVGVASVGQRIAILKAVYQAKLAYQVPLDPDHYVPPSEAQERVVTVEKLHDLVKEQAQRVHILEEENKRLNETVQVLLDEYSHSRSSQRPDEPSLKRQPSFKWAQYVNPGKSPTKPEAESPNPSPRQMEHDLSQVRSTQPTQLQAPSTSQRDTTSTPSESPLSGQPLSSSSRANRQESSDNLKSFKVSLEDPTWKVLPAALKKYKINNDNWQNYAMFICYGSPGNRIERCLSYDEKPLLLFQKLKDAKKNPVFMLKHIKDIRSPIAVAQQKHALRKASVSSDPSSSNSHPNKLAAPGQGKAVARPPKLEVSDLSTPAAPLTGTAPQAGWPETMSPIVDSKSGEEATSNKDAGSSSANPSHGPTDGMKSRSAAAYGLGDGENAKREMPPSTTGISYAVAIYPYMAEQDDEFDVVVGDTFVILSRARGWWVVQRDPTGSGAVDTDTSKQGWVPAGCLLETNVPVASAIAEATASAKVTGTSEPQSNLDSNTPILPLSIISTSFPGIALMDYKKKGEEELDLVKDDSLRVFKRYNHWSYAVKEEGGDRGWVPSWFIGKVPTPGAAPPTPSTSSGPAMNNGPSVSLDADSANQNQVSPMSSAFPMQNRNGVI
ncbi:hypothetical protein F5I97DRAFT_1933873 [Phlebopus sp. FC_14]|nr:hypothetical protein F5I97DRAFT_1933873 [Phlebopus sp. FC_14]